MFSAFDSQTRKKLIAAISCISIVGVSLSLVIPLLALRMEAAGFPGQRQWIAHRRHGPRHADRRAADAVSRPRLRRARRDVPVHRSWCRRAAGLRLCRRLWLVAGHPRGLWPVAHRHFRGQRILDQRRRAARPARHGAGHILHRAGDRLRHRPGAAEPDRLAGSAALSGRRRDARTGRAAGGAGRRGRRGADGGLRPAENRRHIRRRARRFGRRPALWRA